MARIIIDVRSSGEYAAAHSSKARNLPLEQVPARIGTLAKREDEVWVCCASGARSAQAARKLKELGYQRVKDLGPWTNLT